MLGVFGFYLYEAQMPQIGRVVADEDEEEPYEDPDPFDKKATEAWHSLAHVCRRWRSIVFEAPLSLDLKLVCTPNTPARDTLDVWPEDLPLCVRCAGTGDKIGANADNIIAVLERSNRVVEITLSEVCERSFSILSKAMQKPFPKLKELTIRKFHISLAHPPIIPESFLGGSAPSLKFLMLDNVKFGALPNLLWSTSNLVNLIIQELPYFGHIPPREMLAILSALTCLEYLWLELNNFRFNQQGLELESRPSHPPTHSQADRQVLPSLTFFHFEGLADYLEDLLVDIDAPQLSCMRTSLENHTESSRNIDAPQLIQFICRTPILKALNTASVVIEDLEDNNTSISVKFWQSLSGEQVSTSSLPLHCKPELAYLDSDLHTELDHVYGMLYESQGGEYLEEDALWLRFLLLSFTAVKDIYLSKEFALCIVHVLQEFVGGRMRRPLPLLQNIFLEEQGPSGPIHEGIFWKLMAEQQASSHPITVTRWV